MRLYRKHLSFTMLIILLTACNSVPEPQPTKLEGYSFKDLKADVKIGLAKKKVTESLGGPTSVIEQNSLENIPDNPEYWIYDFINNENHIVGRNEEDPFKIDIDGLRNEDINMQLLISWSSEIFSSNRKVTSYLIYYKENGDIYRYSQLLEGDSYSIYDEEQGKFIKQK